MESVFGTLLLHNPLQLLEVSISLLMPHATNSVCVLQSMETTQTHPNLAYSIKVK